MNKSTKLQLSCAFLGCFVGFLYWLLLVDVVRPENFIIVLFVPYEISFLFIIFATICPVIAAKQIYIYDFSFEQGALVAALSYFYFVLLHVILAIVFAIYKSQDFLGIIIGFGVIIGHVFVGLVGVLIPVMFIGGLGGYIFNRYVT